MRKIVCFGDSNTYGFSPFDGSRYEKDVRWTGVLDKLLGDKFEVINEGKIARTIAFDDPYNEGSNGMADIGACIDTNEPFDLMIIMLGTNDLKAYFESTPQMIADNLLKMCEFVREKTDARLLLASPMLLGDQIEFSQLRLEFGRQQVEYSFELAPHIQKVAEQVGAEFIDIAVVAMSSDVDCLHLVPEEHDKLGRAMYAKVLDIFKEELAQEAQEEEEERKKAEEEARQRAEEAARQQAEETARQQAEEAARQQAEEAPIQQGEVPMPQDETMSLLSEDVRVEEGMGELHLQATSIPQDETMSLLVEGEELEEETRKLRLRAEAILRAAEEPVEVPDLDVRQESPLLSTPFTAAGLAPGEKEKMLSGKLYTCDAELKAELAKARELTNMYNETTDADISKRNEILSVLFEYVGQGSSIEPPFRCDYGRNILVGDNFHANFDCIMLDAGRIKIGNNVFLGPRVSIYTACCPIYAPVRNEGLEYAKEVCIGDDVWIGGNVTINPGVHIGNNVVIGSGSVVTGDIPDGVVAAGNPCRIIRRISDSDKTYWEEKKAEREE